MHGLGVETEGFVDRHEDAIIDLIISGGRSQEVRYPVNCVYVSGIMSHCAGYINLVKILFNC